MELSDRIILEHLRNNDEQAFEDFFRTYYQRLCNYSNTILNDMVQSEEIVQGAFLTIWEKRESIEIHSSLKSYLYRAVYNSSLNHVKHMKVQRKHEQYFQNSNSLEYENASEKLMEEELDGLIRRAVDQLPPQCQIVFKLSRFENMSYAEISSQMNISVKTVENHIVKALKILRDKLKDYLPLLLLLFINRN